MTLTNIPFSIIIEWMCLIASILLLRTTLPKFWKWFIPYLGITVAVESYSYIVNRVLHLQIGTHWIYNSYLLIYLIFHIYIFYRIIDLHFIKATCLTCLFFLIGCYALDCYNLGFTRSFSRTNTFFTATVIMLSVLYYYSLFQKEESKDILKEPSFWFVTGCLMFYATSTGVTALFDQIVNYNQDSIILVRRMIIAILNIIMYGCWIKSFICLQKTQTYLRA
jgi:hypothetical protein